MENIHDKIDVALTQFFYTYILESKDHSGMDNDVLLWLGYEVLPDHLSPQARLIFLCLIFVYGDQAIDLSGEVLHKKLGFSKKRFHEGVAELEREKLLNKTMTQAIGISKQVIYTIHVELLRIRLKAKFVLKDTAKAHYQHSSKSVRLFSFIEYLLKRYFDGSSISLLEQLTPNDILILLVLLRKGNQSGLVSGLSTQDFRNKTGLSRASIFRGLDRLSQYGLLRCRVNGVNNNLILGHTEPLYVLNLSHELWGNEHAGYGKFIILNYPQNEIFEVQKVCQIFAWFTSVEPYLIKLQKGAKESIYAYIKYNIPERLKNLVVWNSSYLVLQQEKFELESEFFFKLVQHYFELKSYGFTDIASGKMIKPVKNRVTYPSDINSDQVKYLSDLNSEASNWAALQSYCEYCCYYFFNHQKNFKSVHKGTWRVSYDNFYCSKLLDQISILDNLTPQSDENSQKETINTVIALVEFLATLVNLITCNQLLPFFKNMKGLEFVPFIILPKHATHTGNACLFFPDTLQKSNLFYTHDLQDVVVVEFDDDYMAKNFYGKKVSDVNIQFLKDSGLLAKQCTKVDRF